MWGGARAPFAQAQWRPTAPSHLCRAARGGARGRGEPRTARLDVACTGCWFSRVWGVQAGLKQGWRGAAAFLRRFRGYLCLEVICRTRGGEVHSLAAEPPRNSQVPTRQTRGPPSAARASYTGIAVRAGRPAWVDPVRAPAPGRTKWPRPRRRPRLGDRGTRTARQASRK